MTYNLSNCLDDIIDGIGGVGIVHDGGPALWAADGLEASVNGREGTQDTQDIEFVKTEVECGTVDTEEVGDIKASDEGHEDLFAVEVKEHAVEAFLEDLRTVVRQCAGGVSMDGSFAVLGHDETVAVVFVRHRKGCGFEVVEEALLRIAVVIEGLMVVDMIAREVGEECSVEVESCYALLGDGVRGDLHEGMGAARIDHAAKEAVEFDGVGRGMGGGDGFGLDIVDDRGEQSGLVTECTRELIEKRGDGGLAVGAGDADEGEGFGGFAEPLACQQSQGPICILYQNIGRAFEI